MRDGCRLCIDICSVHPLDEHVRPCLTGIPTPEHPGNEPVTGAQGITKVLSPLIDFVPGKEAAHAPDGTGRKAASMHKIPGSGNAHVRTATPKRATQTEPFGGVAGDFFRRDERKMPVAFGESGHDKTILPKNNRRMYHRRIERKGPVWGE